MINQEYVYHSSTISGLKVLEPKPSTHKIPWVYATRDIASAGMFLGDNLDFICQTGFSRGKPYIWERFKGAFDLGYKNKKGSIYYLKPDTFKEGMTSFTQEVVSEVPVKVEKEIHIDNVQEFLLNLEKEGELSLFIFPSTPDGKPSDKEDIVERGVNWTIDFGEGTLNQIQEYHPDVLDRVIKGLQERNYKFKDKKWLKYNK